MSSYNESHNEMIRRALGLSHGHTPQESGALETLRQRLKDRVPVLDYEDMGIPYYSQDSAYPLYHSPEWWDMMWKKHEEWREENYPAAAGTGWEVTPPTGVEISFGSEVQMLEPFPVKPVISG